MAHINLDTAAPAVKKFIRSLAVDASGVEVILDGNVVCKIVPPGQLSDAEKAVKLAELRQLLAIAQENSKRLPPAEIEGKIRKAMKTVRKGR